MSQSSMIGRKIGNYNITRQLGEGGMGAVYLGEHPLIGKKVAVKVLHDALASKEDIVSRFFTEAKAVNDIHHENIVDIVDFGKVKDEATGGEAVYFVMELLEGESLAQRLKRAPVTPAETCHIIAQCGSALAASHAHNIVHRDLKPDNIYLVTRGHDTCFVKILDFGIAKLTGGEANAGMTRAGSVIGTPAYMSPEQCDGKGLIDWRSDVYSLGVVMYEMMCGRTPFTGEGFGEVLVAQLTLAPPLPSEFAPGLPPGLEAIVMRCLEKDRLLRFQSMDELREAVASSESYVPPRPFTGSQPMLDPNGLPTMASLGGRPTTLSGAAGEVGSTGGGRAPSTTRIPLIAGLASGILLLGVGGYFLTRGPATEDIHAAAIAAPPGAPAGKKVTAVQILIDSTPEGAQVMRAGLPAPLGKTPLPLKLARGIPQFDVLITLDGYKSETRTISTDTDRDILVALAKSEPVAAPKPAAAATGASTGSGGGSSASKPVALPRLPHADDDEIGLLPDKAEKPDKPERKKKEKSVDPDGVLAPQL